MLCYKLFIYSLAVSLEVLSFHTDCQLRCLQYWIFNSFAFVQAQQPVAVNHIGKDTKKESKEREKEREKERNAVIAMKLQIAGGGHL